MNGDGIKLRIAVIALTLVLGVVAGLPSRARQADAPSPMVGPGNVVGSGVCRTCHEPFYKLWATSFHGLATRPYSDAFAKDNLTAQGADVTIGQTHYRAEIGPGQGWVRESGAGTEKKYRIAQVIGGKTVFYFLAALDKGRLQTLPVAFDVRKREWFDMAGSGVRHAPGMTTRAYDWKDWRYTFNTACQGCHVSQFSSNYDARTDRYRTKWVEPGINCETCHGPGGRHVAIGRAARGGAPPKDLGLIRGGRAFTREQNNALCASCHAKAARLSASFRPGERYFDHFDLTTYESPDYTPDGRDLGENYSFTSWSRSPCVRAGDLDCLHCHTSSGRYRFAEKAVANDACLPCHAARVADVSRHSHHTSGSDGSRCVSCHMPTTEAARMRRSDHSMLPPTPAATMAFGSPNACNGCHADKTAAWADGQVRTWFAGDYQDGVLKSARLVDAARRGDWSGLSDMLAYLDGNKADDIVAASLIRLLRHCPDARKWPPIVKAVTSPSPLVRAAAAEALGALASKQAVDALVAATSDDLRLVRVRAAASLSGMPRSMLALSETDDRALRKATGEYLDLLLAQPDLWMSQYNLGNYYFGQGDLQKALVHYQAASRLDRSSVPPLINAALVYAKQGDDAKAESALTMALANEPWNAEAHFNMGLLKAGAGDVAEAEKHFRAALETDPDLAEAAYNLGVLLANDRLGETLTLCRHAAELRPEEPRYGYTLAYYLVRAGDRQGAVGVLIDLLRRHPGYRDARGLLSQIRGNQP